MSKRARHVSQSPGSNNQILQTNETSDPAPREEISLEYQLDTEIECPRCKEIMELFSSFDRLNYLCGSCNLGLNLA
jgi:transposase-like protein